MYEVGVVKEEYPQQCTGEYCHLCLSTERRLKDVEKCILHAYGFVTDWSPIQGVRVCWECNKKLHNLQLFKLQAEKAKQLIENFTEYQQPFTSLSNLNIILKSENCIYIEHIEAKHHDDTNIKNESHNLCDEIFADPILPIESKLDLTDLSDDTPPLNDYEFNTEVIEASFKNVKKRKGKINKKVVKKFEDFTKNPDVKIIVPNLEQFQKYGKNYFVLRKSKYKCENCLMSFPNDRVMQSHKRKFHYESIDAYDCHLCNCRFKTEKHLKLHTEKHRNFCLYKCLKTGCNYIHHSRRYMVVHQRRHNDLEKDLFKTEKFDCDYCGFSADARKKIIRHIKKHLYRFYCTVCGYSAANRAQLKIHELSHLGPEHRAFECNLCSRRFSNKYKLQVHLKVHNGEKTPCEFCGRGFADKYHLAHHIRKRHRQTEDTTNKIAKKPPTKPVFVYGINESKLNQSTTGKFNQFKNIKPYKGTINTSADRPHQCNYCGKTFKQKVSLSEHMASHSEERNHKCDVCNATFKYCSNLWTHKRIHSGVKPHECNVCGARFAVKGNLSGHMKTHLADKPHKCVVCSKRFSWNKDLRLHYKKVHPGMDELASEENNV